MNNLVLMQSWKQFGKMMITNEVCGGTNYYKTTDGRVVFLTQDHHHGLAFAHYSQLEFECIIQLQEKVQLQEKAELTIKSSTDLGRKPRPTFPLGINHPLYTFHVGVIGMKMCCQCLPGHPLQNFLEINQPKMNHPFSNGTKT